LGAGVDPVDETVLGKHVDAGRELGIGRHVDASYNWQVECWQLVDLLVIRVGKQQKRLRHQVCTNRVRIAITSVDAITKIRTMMTAL